jgi:hypothetical protein
LFSIVRIPVSYGTHIESGFTELQSIFKTLNDTILWWYCVYFGVTIISLYESELFLSILLLYFVVLVSTTRDVLKAVQYPAKQLMN